MLYPVSAVLALDSFDNGDYGLLEESNIPSLKRGLLTIMNSQQQMAGVYATERLIDRFTAWFSSLSPKDFTDSLSRQIDVLTNADTKVSSYFSERSALIDGAVQRIHFSTEQQLSSWLSEEKTESVMRRIFIKHLSSVAANTKEAVSNALSNAENEVLSTVLLPLEDGLRKAVNAFIIRNTNEFFSDREKRLDFAENQNLLEESGIPSTVFLKDSIIKYLKEGLKADLPKFKLSIPQLLLHQNIMQTLIVPYITLFVNKYRKAWRGFLPEYTQKWYSILLQAEPMGLCDKFRNIVYSHKGAVNEKISSSEVKYQETKSLIDGAFDKFKNLKEELLL